MPRIVRCMDYDVVDQRIVPNYMQSKALKELNRNRALGIQRSLIISATGSGKTEKVGRKQ